MEEIETEYWAVHYSEQDPSKSEDFENDDFEDDLAQFEAEIEARRQQSEQELGPPDPGDWEPFE